MPGPGRPARVTCDCGVRLADRRCPACDAIKATTPRRVVKPAQYRVRVGDRTARKDNGR